MKSKKMQLEKCNVEQLLEIALKETKAVYPNEAFLVKDLFKGYQWRRISLNNRLLLGRVYLENVLKNDISVELLAKTSSNQQKYIKK